MSFHMELASLQCLNILLLSLLFLISWEKAQVTYPVSFVLFPSFPSHIPKHSCVLIIPSLPSIFPFPFIISDDLVQNLGILACTVTVISFTLFTTYLIFLPSQFFKLQLLHIDLFS
jgi:hypothetical protein